MDPYKIAKKYSEYKIPKKEPSFDEICFPREYKIQVQQKFLEEFFKNSNTNGIILYHGIGSGKSCSSIRMVEQYKHEKNIIIAVPASLIDNYKTELRSPCAGNEYISNSERMVLKEHNPEHYIYKEVSRISDEMIERYYTIMSYNKMIDYINDKSLKLKNSILIIDEVHNIISEHGTYYNTLKTFLEKQEDYKLILMTATPIYDNIGEIPLLFNLLPNMKEKLPVGSDFYKMFIKTTKLPNGEYKHENINMELFREAIKGKVSFYRGHPLSTYPKKEMKVVHIKMSNYQKKLYDYFNGEYKKNPINFISKNIKNEFYIATRAASNITYPNGKIDGLNSFKEKDMTFSKLEKYSPKFLYILKKIIKSPGPCYVYSNFKEYGGLYPFMKILEAHGFLNYDGNGVGQNRYAVWSGDETQEKKEKLKSVYNKLDNRDASLIRVLLISPSGKEGLSLFNVRQIHILEPYWNDSRIQQCIGRGLRYCGSKDLPASQRVVEVYLYLSVHPDIDETVDQLIYRIAKEKAIITHPFLHIMKESAVDCVLFKDRNNQKGEPIIKCQ